MAAPASFFEMAVTPNSHKVASLPPEVSAATRGLRPGTSESAGLPVNHNLKRVRSSVLRGPAPLSGAPCPCQ